VILSANFLFLSHTASCAVNLKQQRCAFGQTCTTDKTVEVLQWQNQQLQSTAAKGNNWTEQVGLSRIIVERSGSGVEHQTLD